MRRCRASVTTFSRASTWTIPRSAEVELYSSFSRRMSTFSWRQWRSVFPILMILNPITSYVN